MKLSVELNTDTDKLRHQNRVTKLLPKLGQFYCSSCDKAIVGKGERCPACNAIHSKGHHRPFKHI